MIERGTLANGVPLLCEPVDTTETCAIGFWFPTGSRDERSHERGHSHFLEHMVFKGTGCRTALEIAVQIDRVGGNINAFTDRETTCFYCTLPAAHADLALEILCDMVSSATLSEIDIGKEKVVVSNEIRAADDSPEEQSYQLFLEGMWGSHPLAARVAGVEEDVARIDRGALMSFYRDRYHPSSLVVAAAGDVDFDATARILTKRLVASREPVAGEQRVPPTQRHAHDYADSEFQQGADLCRDDAAARPGAVGLLRAPRAVYRVRRVDEFAPVPTHPRGCGAVLLGRDVPQPLFGRMEVGDLRQCDPGACRAAVGSAESGTALPCG